MNVDSTPEIPQFTRLSGRAVVVGMFLFGITATGVLWLYWTRHTGPFRPFQDALAVEFPGSVPRVEGGQRKMHKGTARILRVTLRVEFDPTDATTPGEQVADRVRGVAGGKTDLTQFDTLQVFLYQGVPEQNLRQREFTRNLSVSVP